MDTTLEVLDVQERDIGDIKPPSFPTAPAPSTTGFPAPRKRVSAFKQQRLGKTSASTLPTQGSPGSSSQDGGTSDKDTSVDERRGIDEENKAVLNSMSPDQIAEAQRELFNGLDPKLVQMLLRRANLDEPAAGPSPFDEPAAEPSDSASVTPPASSRRATVEDVPEEDTSGAPSRPPPEPTERKPNKKTVTFDEVAAPPVPPPDLFPITNPPRPHAESTTSQQQQDPEGPHNTHFPRPPRVPDLDPSAPDFLETMHKKYFPTLPADPSKLAWMAPLPTPHSTADRDSPYYPGQDSLPVSALRFDFRGALLPPRVSRAVPVTKGLHHHGEAPEAAGYTIPELAMLARSAVPAQRCLAYQTLGRMLYRLGRGDWGVGEGGRDGEEDDLAFALWRCFKEGRVLESLEAEAGLEEGRGHLSCKAYATEALWLFEKGGWREKWRGL